MKSIKSKPIIFVGAGPGDPDLITIKGRRALKEADVVIYTGSLVPETLLGHAREGTRVINSAKLHLSEIITEMNKGYQKGYSVVRLHTGDPSLYGAISEQIAELKKRSIPFTIIPGVTAAFGAAASMGIEYTMPEVCQTLIFTRMEGRTPVPDKENLVSLASHEASMAIYLSISLIEDVIRVLTDAYGHDSICAVVYRASQPEEKIIYSKLKNLLKKVKEQNIKDHALIIVGKVLNMDPDQIQYQSKLYDKAFSHGFRE